MKNKELHLRFLLPFGLLKEEILTGDSVTFGRETGKDDADLTIPSPVLSRHHGEFACIDGTWCYRDTGSKNGSWLNGVKLHEQEWNALSNGSVLTFLYRSGANEGTELTIIAEYAERTEGTEYIVKTEAEPAANAEAAGIVHAENEDTEYKVNTFAEKIISACPEPMPNADIEHMESAGREYLENADTDHLANAAAEHIVNAAVMLNEMPLQKEAPVERKEVSPDEGKQLSIDIHSRTVGSGKKTKTLLKNISLTVDPGDMVLILGGSGAGKTTFLHAVMGYEKADAEIRFGDLDVYEDYDALKYEIGYVPQKDWLRGSDSVYDTLFRNAQMKLPAGTSTAVCEARTDQVLQQLGLAKESETMTGRLSGGQRKRLSVAVELIGDPGLFFLDEPDSGLDGIMARDLMEDLKYIADMGKIVMIITHGPDRAADLFTKVLVLAKSEEDNCGHLAYYGGIDGAKEYFGASTLEGIVKKINRTDEGGEGLADYYIHRYEEIQAAAECEGGGRS